MEDMMLHGECEPALNKKHVWGCLGMTVLLPVLIPISLVYWIYFGIRRAIIK